MYLKLNMSVAIVIFVAAGVVLGCAKRPATTAATAPPPATPPVAADQSGPGSAPGSAAAPRAVTPAPSAPAPVPPHPREFTAIGELEDIHFDFDKYDIRPGDARILDANAQWMQANPST